MPMIKCPECKKVINSAIAEVVSPNFHSTSIKTGKVTKPTEGVIAGIPAIKAPVKKEEVKK